MIFCIGNGKSREAIDLHFLKKKGIIYGSNALYRDFSPDILVTSDPKMMKLPSKYRCEKSNDFWDSRRVWPWASKPDKINKTHTDQPHKANN